MCKKKVELIIFLKTAPKFFRAAIESAVRRTWRKNTAGRQHRQLDGRAVADQTPVVGGLDFNWTPLYIPRVANFNPQEGHLILYVMEWRVCCIQHTHHSMTCCHTTA